MNTARKPADAFPRVPDTARAARERYRAAVLPGHRPLVEENGDDPVDVGGVPGQGEAPFGQHMDVARGVGVRLPDSGVRDGRSIT